MCVTLRDPDDEGGMLMVSVCHFLHPTASSVWSGVCGEWHFCLQGCPYLPSLSLSLVVVPGYSLHGEV